MSNLKEQLLDEWMKENPPFDNDKESFEDFLVRHIKTEDANHAIQMLELEKSIQGLHSQLKIEILANENLRREHKNLQTQLENSYSEDQITNVLNKFFTESAVIIDELRYDYR